MKVLDLQCAHQHLFEGWFCSEGDYASQLARGLVACPLCGDTQIQKMLSAPRLNLRAGRDLAPGPDEGAATQAGAPSVPATVYASAAAAAQAATASNADEPALALPDQRLLQARLLTAMRKVLAETEDVGQRFASEARAMHHGEKPSRNIRGQATPDDARALREEGIDVLPLPALPGLKESLH